MFTRSILIPSLVVCAIAAPILLSEKNVAKNDGIPYAQPELSNQVASYPLNANSNTFLPSAQSSSKLQANQANQQNAIQHGARFGSTLPSRNLSAQTQYARQVEPFQQAAFPGSPAAMSVLSELPPSNPPNEGSTTSPPAMIPFGLNRVTPLFPPQTNHTNDTFSIDPLSHSNPVSQFPQPQAMMPPVTGYSASYPSYSVEAENVSPELMGMTPDYGAAQTLIFPGNAFGPDLQATPLEFLPITDFNEIIQFELTEEWVKRRWKRVSTNPGDVGLHGLRVALVTGTNSWDLHGSLTYFFDSQQRLQRITFRGWTGDARRLLQLLTSRYQFQPQQTHLAGFYVAQNRRRVTGGVLMKNPPVIHAENTVEQLAIVMEINNPSGSFNLSEEFRALIAGSNAN